MYRPNLKFVALPVREIIATEVLGGGCEPQSWGRGGCIGGRDGTVRKSEGEYEETCHQKLAVAAVCVLLGFCRFIIPVFDSAFLVA